MTPRSVPPSSSVVPPESEAVLEPSPEQPRVPSRWAFRVGLVLIGVSAISQWLASRSPALVEEWYAGALYPIVARALQSVVGAVPFSVAETLLLLIVLGLMGWVLWFGGLVVRAPRAVVPFLFNSVRRAVTLIGPAYALFLLTWGFTYQRPSLAEQAGLPDVHIEPEHLAELSHELLQWANRVRADLPEDEDGVMRLPSREDVYRQAPDALRAASRMVRLAPATGPVRGAWISPVMSHLGITGIFIPYTGEAHINADYLDPGIPFVACHELAHQAGFAREDEANFLAYYACRESADPAFQYSGLLAALRYLLSVLEWARPDLHAPLVAEISPAVMRDFAAVARFWDRHSGPVETVSSAFQDTYLRTQGQDDGKRSYGRMVDLMISEQRARRE